MSKYILHCPEDSRFEPDPRGMGVYFLEKLRSHKDKIAQIDGITGKTQTFEDLMWRSIRVAQHLQEKGITRRDIITLCAYNSFDACLPYLSALYLGVRFSSLDPTLATEDCVHLLNIVKPKFLFCDNECLNLMITALKKTKLETEIVVLDDNTSEYISFSELLVPTGTENKFEAKPVKDWNDTAVIFFSSGTTGLPKGICTTHYGLLSKWQHQKNESVKKYEFRSLIFTTFYWISAVAFFNGTIINGNPRIICNKFTPDIFLKAVETHKVSVVFLTPFQICNILAHPNVKSYDISCIYCLVVGGSAISHYHLNSLRNLLPNSVLFNGFGITETQGTTTFFNIVEDVPLMEKKIGSIGKPFQGFTYKVVDPETEEILGPNKQGELRVKGKALMRGYYNNPDATVLAYDDDGFFKTGDIVYYDEDNCFYVVDRIKEMFKFQSWHILPAELEAILLTHPDVKEVAVIGMPHDIDGDQPMAIIVLKPGASSKQENILNFFNSKVPDRKQLRAGVKFVDNLPYTPSGKIRRRHLRQTLITNLGINNMQ